MVITKGGICVTYNKGGGGRWGDLYFQFPECLFWVITRFLQNNDNFIANLWSKPFFSLATSLRPTPSFLLLISKTTAYPIKARRHEKVKQILYKREKLNVPSGSKSLFKIQAVSQIASFREYTEMQYTYRAVC